MSLLRGAARAYLLHRLTRGDRRARGRSGPYAPYGSRNPYRRGRSRRRSGFRMVGPLPTYTRQTRGGSRVSVSGCCLPIPLALAAGTAAATRLALRDR